MRITNLAREQHGERARVAADVVWETIDRPTSRIHFETIEPFAPDLALDPHAFLLAAIVPAFRAGEARIAIDGAVCPRLRNGLETVMQVLAQWYDSVRTLPKIEPRDGFRPPMPCPRPRTGMFLSGGVDSLAMLRCNRLDYPMDHPGSVRDCFFVYGFDIGMPGAGDQTSFFEQARRSLLPVIQDAGAELIPVYTNLRILDPEGSAWPDEWFGIATASVAHAFSGRISSALIAASLDIKGLVPVGSHPFLDQYFSSAGLQIIHDGAHMSRLQKIRLVADWAPALKSVRVCWAGVKVGGPLNCGQCRKCMRTMLGFLAIGKLDQAETFPVRQITPTMLHVIHIDNAHLLGFSNQLIENLRAIGRQDLADGLAKLNDAYVRRSRWEKDLGWRGALRRFDKKYLGGCLIRASRVVDRLAGRSA